MKNIKRFLFSSRVEKQYKFALAKSSDDKAYLRPGTSEGFSGQQKCRILMPSAEERSRKLPKYDFPESKVYITPATHRILKLLSETIDNMEEKIVSNRDSLSVFVRPKAYVGSSGTTWASETMDLIAMYQDDYEVDNSDTNDHPTYSTSLRKFFHAIKNYLQQFKYMTTAEDLNCVSGLTIECKFATYEELRLKHLVENITQSHNFLESCTLCDAEQRLTMSRFVPSVVSITNKVKLIIVLQTDVEKEFLNEAYESLLSNVKQLLSQISELKLPMIKP